MFWPVITGHSEPSYRFASGLGTSVYLGHWLLVSARPAASRPCCTPCTSVVGDDDLVPAGPPPSFPAGAHQGGNEFVPIGLATSSPPACTRCRWAPALCSLCQHTTSSGSGVLPFYVVLALGYGLLAVVITKGLRVAEGLPTLSTRPVLAPSRWAAATAHSGRAS